jgi:hypothetical protein
MLTLFFITNRQFNQEMVKSFVKRFVLLIQEIKDDNIVYPFLIMLSRMISMYPNTKDLLDSSEDDYFDNKTNDPTLANGKNANIYKNILNISKVGLKSKQLCEDLLANKVNKVSEIFKNYKDLLLQAEAVQNKDNDKTLKKVNEKKKLNK